LSGEFNFPLEENMAESKETTKENSRTVLWVNLPKYLFPSDS
jgi:hypothetical protein